MAGIGFELRKIYGRKTLAATIWGTFYATISTIGPAVLSAVLILVLNVLMSQSGMTIPENRFFTAATVHAFTIATLVSTFFSAPVSRYIADCVYLHKDSEICPSAFGLLTITSAISGAFMLYLCIALYQWDGDVALDFLVGYYLLGVLVTVVYSMMTYASALKQYKALTYSFLFGILLAVAMYFMCRSWFGASRVTSGIWSLVIFYFEIAFVLIYQCIKAFGITHEKRFGFLSYLRRYPKLIAAGFAYTLGLYAPTLIYWNIGSVREQVSIFATAPEYDLALFLAIFVNMPSLVIFVVKVETTFYDKYTRYVSALNHGTYELIERERVAMSRALRGQLFFIYEVQLIITIILDVFLCMLVPVLGSSPDMLQMFIMLSIGVYAVFCMYFTIVVFYYFTDYTGACISALAFLAVTIVGAVFAALSDSFLALPLLIGGLCGWIIAFVLLWRRLKKLDSFLMC